MRLLEQPPSSGEPVVRSAAGPNAELRGRGPGPDHQGPQCPLRNVLRGTRQMAIPPRLLARLLARLIAPSSEASGHTRLVRGLSTVGGRRLGQRLRRQCPGRENYTYFKYESKNLGQEEVRDVPRSRNRPLVVVQKKNSKKIHPRAHILLLRPWQATCHQNP